MDTIGVVGPLESLVLDIGQNSSFLSKCVGSLYPSSSACLKVEIFPLVENLFVGFSRFI